MPPPHPNALSVDDMSRAAPERLLSIDECRHRGVGVGLLAGEDMAVDVECEGDGRVAETFGGHANVRAGGEEMRRMRVPEVVQANAGKT